MGTIIEQLAGSIKSHGLPISLRTLTPYIH